MKKTKTTILFNNYEDDELEPYFQGECLLTLVEMIEELNDCRAWIAKGVVGRWNGRREGAKMFDTFAKMVEAIIQDCDYVKVEVVNGKLTITAAHHYGTNCMECRAVNQRGYNVYDNWNYGYHTSLGHLNEFSVLDKIFTNNLFSRNIKTPW